MTWEAEKKAIAAWNTRNGSQDADVERRVHKLVEAARMYEASCRLGGKDQDFAHRRLDEEIAAALSALPPAPERLVERDKEFDRAYVIGAKQMLAIALQSIEAAQKWADEGYGHRIPPALSSIGGES